MITVEWADEARTIIYERYGPGWTWDEAYAAWEQVAQMVEGRGPDLQLSFILDMRESSLLPQDFLSNLRRFGQMSAEVNSNVELRIFVGANQVFRHFMNLFRRVYPPASEALRALFVETVDDAHAAITAHRMEKAASAPPEVQARR
jgi:hypothetical protein